MKIQRRLRQTLISACVFAAVMLAVISVDPRVRDRFQEFVHGGDGLSSLDQRAGELGNALVSAARYQSIENAPLMIFTLVGVVLFVFMLRT